MTKGSNTKYEIYAYAAEYNDLASSDRVTNYFEVGPDQNLYLENLSSLGLQGPIREESGAEALTSIHTEVARRLLYFQLWPVLWCLQCSDKALLMLG